MKKLAIRTTLSLLFLLALLFGPGDSPVGVTLWASAVAVAFVFSVTYFTGYAPLFASSMLIALTVVAPFAVLCAVGLPVWGTWTASASQVATHIFYPIVFGGVRFFVPLIAGAAILVLLGHRVVPNNSSKRTRVPRAT
jgi:hypothetical protein